ncbi:hypothetical protein [Herbiconiux solani]|uniref:hypothetical protein n=1 Tax=Herbiconiux solani TaxID=661329 RepID=UPI000825FD8D|nr:hypothetical protein [Herbiconiux solani]
MFTRSRLSRSNGADESARFLTHDALPVLSAGRHRSPRSGACFMEFASFLAGEKWSDHPSCTHAGVAQLARAVNDMTTDQGRGRLAPLIPSVIGLNTDDERLEMVVAIAAVSAALPSAPLDRQHALAVGALVCREALRESGGTADLGIDVEADLEQALADAPEAARWADAFLERNGRWQRGTITTRQTHATIALAVDGVRSACAPHPDERLYDLLAETIALAERFVAAAEAARETKATDATNATEAAAAQHAPDVPTQPRSSARDMVRLL